MATLPAKSQLTGNVSEGQFKSGMNQLIDYISENVGNTGSTGKQVITTPSTWTVPDGVTTVYISQCGGGGGGSTIFGCGGGGGASVYRQPVTVSPTETITCTIGVGGAGGSSYATSNTNYLSSFSNCSGTDGGTTTFGSYVSTKGGRGSTVSSSGYVVGVAGGNGGTSGACIQLSLYDSGSNETFNGGNGGSSMFGAGGSGGYANMSTAAITAGGDGAGYGAGGGGGALFVRGSGIGIWTRAGNGTNGVIIIEW